MLGDGWVRSGRDEAVIELAGRFGGIMQRQARDWFYNGVHVTSMQRTGFMVDAGLLRRTDNLRWAGTVLWPTMAGMRAARLAEGAVPLAPPDMPGDERMLHRMLVLDWVLANGGRFDDLVTEREFRSVERQPVEVAERFAAELELAATPAVDGDGRRRWFGFPSHGGRVVHWPDLVGVWQGKLFPVEIEVTPKRKDRLRETLVCYRQALRSGHAEQVLWLVTPAVRSLFEGYQTVDGRWADGLLAQLGFTAKGGPPDWSQPGLPLTLRDVEPADEGLRYALDQRRLPAAARTSYRQWRSWQALWRQRVAGEPVEFVEWVARPDVLRMLHTID